MQQDNRKTPEKQQQQNLLTDWTSVGLYSVFIEGVAVLHNNVRNCEKSASCYSQWRPFLFFYFKTTFSFTGNRCAGTLNMQNNLWWGFLYSGTTNLFFLKQKHKTLSFGMNIEQIFLFIRLFCPWGVCCGGGLYLQSCLHLIQSGRVQSADFGLQDLYSVLRQKIKTPAAVTVSKFKPADCRFVNLVHKTVLGLFTIKLTPCRPAFRGPYDVQTHKRILAKVS